MVALIWPKILELEKARKMIRRGVWPCLIFGGLGFISAFSFNSPRMFGFSAIWLLIAWGIRKKSILAAALGLAGILYDMWGLWCEVKMYEDFGFRIFASIYGLLYFLCFFIIIGSIRGIMAYNEFEAKMKTSIGDTGKAEIADY